MASSSLPYSTIDEQPRRGRKVAVAVALAVVFTATVATLTHSKSHHSTSSQLDSSAVAATASTTASDKVDVYIIAEAFCPNCKEHSYYFDKLVMTPESTKSGLRDVMNLKLEQMVIDGWNSKTGTGMCEKGRWDCEFSRFQLCGQEVTKESDSLDWWDYSRCLYEHQAELIDYYYDNDGDSPLLMHRVTSNCAVDAGLDSAAIKECVDTEGTELLYESFKRIGDMSDPVWIYVNGQRIGYHEDWLAAICAAAIGMGHFDIEECDYLADVGRK